MGRTASSVGVSVVGAGRRSRIWYFLHSVLALFFGFGVLSLLGFAPMCRQEMNPLVGRICGFGGAIQKYIHNAFLARLRFLGTIITCCRAGRFFCLLFGFVCYLFN